MSLSLPQRSASIQRAALPLPSSLVPLMAPKRDVGRGRIRRGRGGRTPRSCLDGLHGAAPVPSSSPLEEGFWRCDFLLHVRGQSANRVLLPSAFSAVVAERGLDGLLLHLQGSCRSPSYVDLEFDSSRLIFLCSGWSLFARRLNLRDGDVLSCRFDGESTITVRAFDPSGNSMDPRWQESSSDSSTESRSPSPASSTTSSFRDSSGVGGEPSSTASISGSGEDLDVKPPVKRARQATL